MTNTTRNKIYFASDFHLGEPNYSKSLEREKKLVEWLNQIKNDALELYLMGDLFDFWFEYKTVVPKGFVRFLGKLCELSDLGVNIFLFRGNHDMWAFDYLQHEAGITLTRTPEIKELLGKRFFLAHGDGLGPGDYGYKFIKWIFEQKINQFLFRWIHPDISIRFANFWSRSSRRKNVKKGKDNYFDKDNEWMVIFAKEKLKENPEIDFFIFGHRHIPNDFLIGDKARFINLGDWVNNFTYAQFDGERFELKKFQSAL